MLYNVLWQPKFNDNDIIISEMVKICPQR